MHSVQYVVLCVVTLYRIVLHIVSYCTERGYTALHFTGLHCMVLYGDTLYGIILGYIVLYRNVWGCMESNCIVHGYILSYCIVLGFIVLC